MTLLLDADALAGRRPVARGALAPLAVSLASDLVPLLARGPHVPVQKARLTRAGGRCAADGSLLQFDPLSPRSHRCAVCGRVYEGEAHDRYWLVGYQLWLAERAVHAAVLHALGGDSAHAALADAILDGYAERYLGYPNQDNVLGPTRPFFSTYLESIWLLQLCVALDLRERCGIDPALAARARARVVEPSAALIASYDEGNSNRQVWNNAAMLAAARLLGDVASMERVLYGASGLVSHLTTALLADGTWYEGENYHLFAHRGLWYGVVMAEAAGAALPADLVARFQRGFATPFLSALPDFTFPSRRDSQYAVSLRQWRFAELCELGLAREEDPVLAGALHRLYAADLSRGDTGRSRSTAEAERNEPAAALGRADLGWRSLLFAPEELPALRPRAVRSVLLEAQGLAVFRRSAGAAYAALDYGHSGGGHGHPDRLNLLLMTEDARWLDDPGTGSYVDPSLRWYRSTLAHNAPLVNGRPQARRHGRLLAFEERDAAGWARAVVEELAPGVTLHRTLVVMPDYLVDELSWTGPAGTYVDLPMHLDARCDGVEQWEPGEPGHVGPAGAHAADGVADDGFAFLRDTERGRAAAASVVRLAARAGDARLSGWCTADRPQEWWRATAPGPPGGGPRPFLFLRVGGEKGRVRTVWSWRDAVAAVRTSDGELVLEMADGTAHEHSPQDGCWRVGLVSGGARSSVVLSGARAEGAPPRGQDTTRAGTLPHRTVARVTPSTPWRCVVGAAHYRRSELPWEEAGSPAASISVALEGATLVVDVELCKSDPVAFAPARDINELDNEHPDVNGDGVQLHLSLPEDCADAEAEARWAWLIVPEPHAGGGVRVTARGMQPLPLRATARQIPGGYAVRCVLELPAGLVPKARDEVPLLIDVIVNEMPPWRERRRGQLVLSGGRGEFVYLRGDRQPVARLLPFVLADG